MGRKGKTQKHTAAEIAKKHKAAKEAKGAAGGGGAMAKNRKNAGAKVSIVCPICMVQQPNFKSMTAHYENKHPKLWTEEKKADFQKQFDEIRSSHTQKKKDVGKAKGKGRNDNSKKKKKGGKQEDDLFF